MPDEVTRWFAPGDDVGVELVVDWESSGRFAPPPRMIEEDRAFGSGSVLRSARYGPRDLTLSVMVIDTVTGLPAAIRALVYALDPQRGDGVLRVTRTDGTSRDLTCRVVSGLEGVETIGDASGPEHQRFSVTFRAYDPFWYDTADTTIALYSYGDGAGKTTTFYVDSDVQEGAWPVFDAEGALSTLSLTWNPDGDYEQLYLTGLALTTETLTVDTRFGVKAVRKTTPGLEVTNLWPNATGHMWRLRPGNNTVNTGVIGTDSDTSVQLRYRAPHLTC